MNTKKLRLMLIGLILLMTAYLLFSKLGNFEDRSPFFAIFKKGPAAFSSSLSSRKKTNILFVGDMMFDRYIRQVSQKYGYDFPFQKISSFLKDHDLVIGNLEGPITDNPSVSVETKLGEKNNFIFTFDPKIAPELAKENIDLVNLGNNHILNFGQEGLDETKENLQKAGVEFFGDPDRQERFVIKKINGFAIAFVNYNQFDADGEKNVFSDLLEVKKEKPNCIVVFAHWGVEYTQAPGEKVRALAHRLIDNGADLLIGTHPHVIGEKEEYKGKAIYYSLGNFIFDQYFEENTKKGLSVELEIQPDGKINLKDFSLHLDNNGQTSLAP